MPPPLPTLILCTVVIQYTYFQIITVVCLLTVSLTNIASNTATANVLVPILSEMAVTMCINPIYLTLPAGTEGENER